MESCVFVRGFIATHFLFGKEEEKMEKANTNRGFVTIATGDDRYYITAANLLRSYHFFTKEPLPFAILADRENEYTKLFDKTIILEKPHRSYMDKVELLTHIPFPETIFVESDCLAYTDLNILFSPFKNADDFSIFGRSLPLDSTEGGWFRIEETGKYKDKIEFHQRFHSVIIYLRQGDLCTKIYDVCKDVDEHFEEYNIGGNRDGLDDKLFAIGSAVLHCRMTANKFENNYTAFCYYPADYNSGSKPKPNMSKQRVTLLDYKKEKRVNAVICHWANYNTKRAIYKRELYALKYLETHLLKYKLAVLYFNAILPLSILYDRMNKGVHRLIQIKFINRSLKFILHKK